MFSKDANNENIIKAILGYLYIMKPLELPIASTKRECT